ncbi:hypothetical protein HanRHA438_Chr13g0593561 [Helianthus annuus]|nr:hypothetical protein HanRHA438_Chr13g0593561 [Helianthus annuus]
MENVVITVIDNMDVNENHIECVNDLDFFKKTTPYKVNEDVFDPVKEKVCCEDCVLPC